MPVKAPSPGQPWPLNKNSQPNGNKNNNNKAARDQPELDPNDPRVKKLVYRDMLTSYNPEVNKIIGEKDPRSVYIDHGIGPSLIALCNSLY